LKSTQTRLRVCRREIMAIALNFSSPYFKFRSLSIS
jgi:hypothetical protein